MTYPGQNPHRRRRMLLLALAALVVVAAGAVGVTHWLDTRTTHHPDTRSSSPAPSGQVDGCDVRVRAATIAEGRLAGGCLLAKIAESQWKPVADQLRVINAAGLLAASHVVAAPAGATHRVTTPLGATWGFGLPNPTRINIVVRIVYEVQWLQNGLPKTQWCVLGAPVTQGTRWSLVEDASKVTYGCQAQKPDLTLYPGKVQQ